MSIILGVSIEDKANLKGLSRSFSNIMKDVMLGVAEYWHQQRLPRHFFTAARAKYGFDKRNELYASTLKKVEGVGEGKTIDLVLKGKSKRFLMAFPKITGTARSATVTMRPPSYFANPFIGSFVDPKSGKTKRITRQPDKPREVTALDEEDRQALRESASLQMQILLNEARETISTKIKA